MSPDEEFINFIVEERMNTNYKYWKDKPYHLNLDEKNKTNQAYEAVVSMLSKENRNIIQNYLDQLLTEMSLEARFFYCSGIKDGYRFRQYIQQQFSD